MSDVTLPPIPDGTTLERPDDTVALTTRMKALATLRLPSTACRAELAGGLQLLTDGQVTAGDVWQTLLKFYHFAPTSNRAAERLEPVRTDQMIAWCNLHLLVSGDAVPTFDDEGSIRAWLQGITTTLASTMSQGLTHDSEVADMLPSELVIGIEARARREWFRSAYAIGESITASGMFGHYGQFYIADALARAIVTDEVLRKETQDNTEKALAEGRISLWWMLLKAHIHNLLSTPVGNKRGPSLFEGYPVVADRIVAALSIGSAAANSSRAIPTWDGAAVTASERDDLIRRFRERIALEAARRESPTAK